MVWDEAIRMQQHVARFMSEWDELLEGMGQSMIDPVGDKGLAVASGCIAGHQRCRAPYQGWSDEATETCREWLRERYPEFLHPSLRETSGENA